MESPRALSRGDPERPGPPVSSRGFAARAWARRLPTPRESLTEDVSIESYGRRKDEHRDRVGRAGGAARAIFAADKLVNVRALREAYAVRGEAVDGELRVSIGAKLRTWELDLAMLSETEPGQPLVARLAEELAGLRRERPEPATPRSG